MTKRPHESPDCRCDACARYDREQEYPYPYGEWRDSGDVARYMRGCATYEVERAAYEVERAAWKALVDMYDAVFNDYVRDNSRDDS